MKNIDINEGKLLEEITNLKKEMERMNNLFSKIKKENENLKEYWSGNIARQNYLDFEEFYKFMDKTSIDGNIYINFLENVVSAGYTKTEENISKSIDENMIG